MRACDAIEGMGVLEEKSIDVIVTSPPYNLGIKYRKYNDRKEHEVYIDWTKQWLSAAKRVLQDDGSLFLNLGGCPSKPLLPHEVMLVARNFFVLQNTFHWVKSVSVETKKEGLVSVGHFKPITSDRYVNDCHEFVFHLTKTGTVSLDRLALGVPYADKSNIKRWAHTEGRDVRCRGNVWFIPYKTVRRKKTHPATFPPRLAEYAIRIHGSPKERIVLDPFVGLGNSMIGAIQAGAKMGIGFDEDESYIDDARPMVQQALTPKL